MTCIRQNAAITVPVILRYDAIENNFIVYGIQPPPKFPGVRIDKIYSTLSEEAKTQLICQVIEYLLELRGAPVERRGRGGGEGGGQDTIMSSQAERVRARSQTIREDAARLLSILADREGDEFAIEELRQLGIQMIPVDRSVGGDDLLAFNPCFFLPKYPPSLFTDNPIGKDNLDNDFRLDLDASSLDAEPIQLGGHWWYHTRESKPRCDGRERAGLIADSDTLAELSKL
ncbi:uncharacterized protein BO97DRAFT_457715 [Aspergillus homomorphus CBS 101889]|uniref:Uncharacterized protein n=1 Tax=Aspergillus homomorphus (strain CBS 101889) TaxID=1450537 RepID=A0A395HQK8_ASPHC|nr:hypothetical protein BO97DRAFT_457715 [Aspergillus homomorphus CBS 101889]RAL09779.1 hypothetical protein BO97DRAFT_457715 [Aspergillus homomorphus CBS 101889]